MVDKTETHVHCELESEVVVVSALRTCRERTNLDRASACVSPSDPTLTVEKVTEVMGEVGDMERVWGDGFGLWVPDSKQAEIKQQSSTEGEKSRALSQYWVNCAPDVSWERLASTLYFQGEERAAVMAKQYLPKGTCIS